jgi:AcrR family transcriptional regulator
MSHASLPESHELLPPDSRPARVDARTGGRPVRAQARHRILRATLETIAAEGVAAVTTRRVATAAGVSLGSLTYHFDSQSELLREALLLYVEEETARRERVASELEREGATLERVVQAVEQLAGAPDETPRQIAELELHLHAARDPELREASRRCFAAHERIAVAALSALGMPSGERQATVVVALVTGLAVRRLAAGGEYAGGTAEALTTLVRGLSPTVATPE